MLVREGDEAVAQRCTMRAELIDHFEPCMTEIYLHIDARMADYIRTHPYCRAAAHGVMWSPETLIHELTTWA